MPLHVAGRTPKAGANTSADDKQRGLEAFDAKRWQEAIVRLERCLDGCPADVEVLNALALAHAEAGDRKIARSILAQAVKAVPDCAVTYQNLAVMLARDGRILEAADNACRAVELDPSYQKATRVLEQLRPLIRSIKPAPRKKGKPARQSGGCTQADVDSRLSRMNSLLARAAQADREPDAPERPKISLCMIVRDEEDSLQDCLDSVKDVVDEIVVVDTGSTDRTAEIASANGAAVHRFGWTDSFAEARCEAQKHASGDWILVMDADERLDAASKDALLKAVQQPTADGYDLVFRNYLSDGTHPDVFVHRACRLYRNRPEYGFRGRVHEMVAPSIVESGGTIKQLDVVIHHYGYRREAMEARQKSERYIPLLHAELDENPGDVYWLYNLGVAYQTAGDQENAVRYLLDAAEHVLPEHESAPRLFASLANALCATARPEDAMAVLDRAQGMSLYSPELSYCRGSAFSALRRFDEAIAAFQQAIALGQHGHWVGEAGAFGYKANYGIALAYVELGDYTRAAEFAGKAAAQKPDDPEAHQLAAAACMRVKLHDRAEEHLLQLASLKPGDSSVTARLADLYHGQGRFEEAKQQYGVLLEAGHDTPAIRTRLAECMKALGEDDAARRHSAQAAQLRADAQTQTDLGRRLAAEGRVVEALQCFAAAVGADPTHADAYFAAGDVLYAAGEYQRAAEIYQSGLLHSPESAAGFFAIGNCYLRMGAGDAAALAYRQALALRPDYPEAEESLHVAEDLLLQPQAA